MWDAGCKSGTLLGLVRSSSMDKGGSMKEGIRSGYEPPVVIDYGDLVELTAAVAFTGHEDGGSKQLIHHTAPQPPASP